jgi:HrpA-like RNA helicase
MTDPSTKAYSKISTKLQLKIIESVALNRVTVIIGPTGSGKSTLIPSLLLDNFNKQGQSVVCSQPRRLAVLAIAKRVASDRNAKVGHEVGFHVGNQNMSLPDTQLLFMTAGILLEELRANGLSALTKHACVIIDECHERSPVSDEERSPLLFLLKISTYDDSQQ